MMTKLKYILIYALSAVVFLSCKEDENINYGDFLYDIVTYEGKNGTTPVFTFQSYDDSPLIKLNASNLENPNLKKGQRLLLNYIVEEELGHNEKLVRVNGYSKVHTDTIEILPEEKLEALACHEIKIASVWRTGNYLNVRCMLEYTQKPRQLFLATTGDVNTRGIVQTYQIQDLMGAQTYYWFETYMSYYIAPVWDNPECKGIKYNVVDLSYPEVKYYEFLK